MKKTILAALLACLLLLAACQSQGAQESETPTPTPAQGQTAETPPVSPDPETSADPGVEAPEFPQFLKDFTFFRADTLAPNAPELQFVTHCLDPEEQGELQTVLDMGSWWEATDVPAMGLEGATTFYDEEGHTLLIDNWDEETCLVLAKSGSDSYLYFAPYSVLENTRALVDRLTPLGIIDPTAAWYFDLFWNDPGFDALLALAEEDNGRISDDQMGAYALIRVAYESHYDFEVGIPSATIDQLTRKHFGRVMDSYDNSMTKVLPSGNVTATGWDIGGPRPLVLSGTPEEDEYGNISATFLVYILGEEAWMDGSIAPQLLDHIREYVLTGNTSEYPDPIKVSITFRVESETVNGVWREYAVYDAVRVVDGPLYGIYP